MWWRKKKGKVVEFRVVQFYIELGRPQTGVDYPKDMPLPRIGEYLNLEGKIGKVDEIWHSIYGNVRTITIYCKM